jgi:hypothetical protein
MTPRTLSAGRRETGNLEIGRIRNRTIGVIQIQNQKSEIETRVHRLVGSLVRSSPGIHTGAGFDLRSLFLDLNCANFEFVRFPDSPAYLHIVKRLACFSRLVSLLTRFFHSPERNPDPTAS